MNHFVIFYSGTIANGLHGPFDTHKAAYNFASDPRNNGTRDWDIMEAKKPESKPTETPFNFKKGYLKVDGISYGHIRPVNIGGDKYVFFPCNNKGHLVCTNRWNDNQFNDGDSVEYITRSMGTNGSRQAYQYGQFDNSDFYGDPNYRG